MKNMDMNTVISWGLVVMGVLSVAGWIAYSIHTGTSGGTEIPIAISSGLVGVLTGKNISGGKSGNEFSPGQPPLREMERAMGAKALEASTRAIDLVNDKMKRMKEGDGDGKSEHRGN